MDEASFSDCDDGTGDWLAYIRDKGAAIGLTTDARVAEIGEDSALELPRFDCNDFPPKSKRWQRTQ